MRHGRFIYVLGDVHGEFRSLNAFINTEIRQNRTLWAIAPYWKAENDDLQVIILQCGDFAYFWPQYAPPVIRNEASFLPGGRIPIYWTGGNHEDWDKLDSLFQPETGDNIVEVGNGVYYCRFGATWELSPDITVLFAGGAESADKKNRLDMMADGYPRIWWPQEGISDVDMERLGDIPRADSYHTPPPAPLTSQEKWGAYGASQCTCMSPHVVNWRMSF